MPKNATKKLKLSKKFDTRPLKKWWSGDIFKTNELTIRPLVGKVFLLFAENRVKYKFINHPPKLNNFLYKISGSSDSINRQYTSIIL